MLRFIATSAIALAMLVAALGPASADGHAKAGSNGIWVMIQADPGEGLWQACRRIFSRGDVYQVRGDYKGRPGIVWCNIDTSAYYDPRPPLRVFD